MGQGITVVSQADYGFPEIGTSNGGFSNVMPLDGGSIVLGGNAAIVVNNGQPGAYGATAQRVALCRITPGGVWLPPVTYDITVTPDGFFGGAAVLGPMTPLGQGRYAYVRGVSGSPYGAAGTVVVDPAAATIVNEGEINPGLWTANPSYTSVAGTEALIVGVGPGVGAYFPGKTEPPPFTGNGPVYASPGYDGFHLMQLPPAGPMVVDSITQGWTGITDEFGVPDHWVQGRAVHRVDDDTVIVTLAHFDGGDDTAVRFTRFTLVALRVDVAGFAFTAPVTVSAGLAGAAIRPLADGRLLAVWVDEGAFEVHVQYLSVVDMPTQPGTPQVVLGAEQVVPFVDNFGPRPSLWALTADELSVVLTARYPPYGSSGLSARRLRRFGESWEFVVDDTVHPLLGGAFGGGDKCLWLRDDLGVVAHRGVGLSGESKAIVLSLVRVATVPDDASGVVGMVPGSP